MKKLTESLAHGIAHIQLLFPHMLVLEGYSGEQNLDFVYSREEYINELSRILSLLEGSDLSGHTIAWSPDHMQTTIRFFTKIEGIPAELSRKRTEPTTH